jgi:hypothetical protein
MLDLCGDPQAAMVSYALNRETTCRVTASANSRTLAREARSSNITSMPRGVMLHRMCAQPACCAGHDDKACWLFGNDLFSFSICSGHHALLLKAVIMLMNFLRVLLLRYERTNCLWLPHANA